MARPDGLRTAEVRHRDARGLVRSCWRPPGRRAHRLQRADRGRARRRRLRGALLPPRPGRRPHSRPPGCGAGGGSLQDRDPPRSRHPRPYREGPRGVPPRRPPLLEQPLAPRRSGRPDGPRDGRGRRGHLPPSLCSRPQRPGPGHAWPVPLPDRMGVAAVATCPLPYAPAHSARGRVMRGLYRYHASRLQEYDRCIALSEDQRDLLVHAGVPSERVTVMRNAVDTRRIHPGPSSLKQALGAGLIVTFLGRLDPEKRADELIESFRARRWPSDHLLLIAGNGSQDRKLRSIVGSEGTVRFLGMVTGFEDRLELLRATDLFVLPSTAEGLSLSLLEAMAAGCPIVATDAGEHRAVLDGAGLIIPVYPLEPALGEAMERLRGQPGARRRLGEAARARVVETYALDRYVERLLRLYERTVGGERRLPGRGQAVRSRVSS